MSADIISGSPLGITYGVGCAISSPGMPAERPAGGARARAPRAPVGHVALGHVAPLLFVARVDGAVQAAVHLNWERRAVLVGGGI